VCVCVCGWVCVHVNTPGVLGFADDCSTWRERAEHSRCRTVPVKVHQIRSDHLASPILPALYQTLPIQMAGRDYARYLTLPIKPSLSGREPDGRFCHHRRQSRTSVQPILTGNQIARSWSGEKVDEPSTAYNGQVEWVILCLAAGESSGLSISHVCESRGEDLTDRVDDWTTARIKLTM
jgi:hypothetical protein